MYQPQLKIYDYKVKIDTGITWIIFDKKLYRELEADIKRQG